MTTLVCVTGMHRSGTSMVARVLSAAGLWLGPPEQMMPVQADNEEGFFEHLDLVRHGDALLDRLGGAWDRPPPLRPRDDGGGTLLAPLAGRGAELLAKLAEGAPERIAAWKDPRASLLLPYWRGLRPDLHVVACLRHPSAVARSLHARNRVSLRYGIDLWQAYNRALWVEAQAGRALITHYDAWLANPVAELERVAAAIGLPLEANAIEALVQPVRSSDRPDAACAGDDALLALGGVPLVRLYDRLRACAGPVYASTPEGKRQPPSAGAAPDLDEQPTHDDELQLLRHRIGELSSELDCLRHSPAPYRMGTMIDARMGGNAPLYLGEGWAAPQDAGTWSLGARASIRLPLHALPPGSGAVLQALVKPMVGPGHERITVTLLANDSPAASWTLAEARPTSVGCNLDARCLGASQPLRLQFVVDRPCAPRTIGLSPDARPLGFLLLSLSLHADTVL